MDDEQRFLDAIDSRFPYDDPARARALIAQGCRLSANAMFAVLHEICRPPRSATVDRARLLALVEEWRSMADHPLAADLAACAVALIERRRLPVPNALRLMERVGACPGQWAALSIVTFAADVDSGETEAVIEGFDVAIRALWRGPPP